MQAKTFSLHMAIANTMEKKQWSQLHYRAVCKDPAGCAAAVIGLGPKGETEDEAGNRIVPIAVDQLGGSGESALMLACAKLDQPTAARLIELGANKNMRDSNGWTPLRYAIEGLDKPHPFIWWLVRDVKVSVNIGDNSGYTPMHCAAQMANLDAIQAILEGFSVLRASVQAAIESEPEPEPEPEPEIQSEPEARSPIPSPSPSPSLGLSLVTSLHLSHTPSPSPSPSLPKTKTTPREKPKTKAKPKPDPATEPKLKPKPKVKPQ